MTNLVKNAREAIDPRLTSHEMEQGHIVVSYGMKGGALDLEKETILAHHKGDAGAGFTIQSLRIQRRLYVFDPAPTGDTAELSARFVRDIVNPSIHTWQIS